MVIMLLSPETASALLSVRRSRQPEVRIRCEVHDKQGSAGRVEGGVTAHTGPLELRLKPAKKQNFANLGIFKNSERFLNL